MVEMNVTTDEVVQRTPVARSPRGWVLTAGAKRVWRDLRDDCRAIPARAWWRFVLTLVIGFVLCAALSVTGTRTARSYVDRGLQSWDERTLRAIEQRGQRHPAATS